MTRPPPHPSRTLLRVLGRRGRLALGIAALGLLLEKVALVGATSEAVGDRPGAAALLGGVLAALFFARSAARSFLKVEVQSRLLEAVTGALLDDDAQGLGPNVDETELTIINGVFASESMMSEQMPGLFGDLPASVCMLALACALLPGRLVLEGGAAMLVGAAAMLAARRVTARSAERAW